MTREQLMKKMEENSLLKKMEEDRFLLERELRKFRFSDLSINNAGLCLFISKCRGLMYFLGYLDESGKDFKDMDMRIRAAFLLQYLAFPEDREYEETELAFNRLLVNLPIDVLLPGQMELTAEEKKAADEFRTSAMRQWPKKKGVSAEDFRSTFVVRTGRLVQQSESWLLTVDEKPYDLLLESIPWEFRRIRLPWMNSNIRVSWCENNK